MKLAIDPQNQIWCLYCNKIIRRVFIKHVEQMHPEQYQHDYVRQVTR